MVDATQLSSKMDAHLTLPMLEFALARGTHDAGDVLRAKLEILSATNMCDLAAEVRAEVSGSNAVSAEDAAKREAVLARRVELAAAAANATRLVSDVSAMKLVNQERKTDTAKNVAEAHGVSAADVEALYKFAKFEYECGEYAIASEHLGAVRLLCADGERCESALWGKFSADILLQNWSAALDDMNRLRDALENNASTSSLVKMKQRAWLLHYALYVFFNHPNGRNLIVDVLFQERYMQAVQQESPYLLRYLAVAVVANKKRRNMIKDLVRIIQSDEYRDPALEFILALFDEYDFAKAASALKECDAMMENDFFLVGCKEAFDENARAYYIENYGRVNKRISIGGLAESLDMSAADVEASITTLIRMNKLDARVDSEAGFVYVRVEVKSVNEQIIEKTKALLSKTNALTQAVLANTQAQAF